MAKKYRISFPSYSQEPLRQQYDDTFNLITAYRDLIGAGADRRYITCEERTSSTGWSAYDINALLNGMNRLFATTDSDVYTERPWWENDED